MLAQFKAMIVSMFMAVNIGTTQPAINIDKVDDIKEVACLSQAVHGEAAAESMEGKIAVAHVIINRTKSNSFPSNSLCGVIQQKGQFKFRPRWINEHKPAERKQMEDSIKASIIAIDSPNDPTHGSLYFVNPLWADQSWLRGFKRTVKIGGHVFYKNRRDM